jgi:hypothetical protein
MFFCLAMRLILVGSDIMSVGFQTGLPRSRRLVVSVGYDMSLPTQTRTSRLCGRRSKPRWSRGSNFKNRREPDRR